MSTSRLNGFYLTILAVNTGLKPGVSGNRSDLNHAELHSPGFADHVLVPRRIPDQLHIRFIDTIDRQNFALRIVRDRRSHSATRRSQGHFYFDARPAVVFFDQATIINQTKIDNVHRNFWVEALLELVPNIVFRNYPVRFSGGL